MSKRAISFADLRRLLLGLGFTHVTVPKSHEAFLRADSETEIFLPLYRSDKRVAPHHLVAVRAMLDAKGVLDGEEFDLLAADLLLGHPASR